MQKQTGSIGINKNVSSKIKLILENNCGNDYFSTNVEDIYPESCRKEMQENLGAL
jgi:hypothetical protein